jgi:hypothetical protein
MIDESLLAKVSSLSPADRIELICRAWDTLSPDDLTVSNESTIQVEFMTRSLPLRVMCLLPANAVFGFTRVVIPRANARGYRYAAPPALVESY